MLIGHKRIWDFLLNSASCDRLAHAYLFYGPPAIGKRTLALDFAKWLACEKKGDRAGQACGKCKSCLENEKGAYADMILLAAKAEEKKGVVKSADIGIEDVREMQKKFSLKPYFGEYKIAVVHEAGNMTREAANSFLKTLEEPKGKSLIILTASSLFSLLPTIVSRCQLIKFLPVAEKEMMDGLKGEFKGQERILKAVRLAGGRPGAAKKYLLQPELFEEQEKNIEVLKKLLKEDLPYRFSVANQLAGNYVSAREILSQWQLWFRDRMLEENFCQELAIGKEEKKISSRKSLDIMSSIQKTSFLLGNPSYNAKMALESLFLKF